jgi:hypothetical protein
VWELISFFLSLLFCALAGEIGKEMRRRWYGRLSGGRRRVEERELFPPFYLSFLRFVYVVFYRNFQFCP